MSELSDKQKRFVRMEADLIIYVYDVLGWELTHGDGYRDPRVPYGKPNSLHKVRLAVDFNLFVDGEYIDCMGTSREIQREWELYEKVGVYWESIGGAWGGRFQDPNHFSLAHLGMK